MTVGASLVSVVIPVYNGAPTIRSALRSAQGQTHERLEILVADDGSADATAEIVRQAAAEDPRIRLLEGAHTGLPGPTRNRALAAARGEAIALLDADDLWSPRKVELQLQALARKPEAVLAHTAALEFSDEATLPDPLTELPPGRASPLYGRELAPGPRGYRELLTRRRLLCTPSALFRAELHDRIGGFSENERLPCAEDLEFFARAWEAGPFVYLPQVCVFVRKHAGNVTAGRAWPAVFECLKEVEARRRLPLATRRAAWSAAWLVRAEEALAAGETGWRAAMARAWAEEPWNVRRWPGLVSAGLPTGLGRRAYFALRGAARPGR